MDLAGQVPRHWLSPEAIETFLGVLEPSQEHAMTTWTVAGQVVGEGRLSPCFVGLGLKMVRWSGSGCSSGIVRQAT